MEIKQVLKDIGLAEKQALVYLAVLELGRATVLEAAKKSGVKRPTAYVILNELSAKGLVSKTLQNKRAFFVAEHPRKLITETELKLQELKTAVPILESFLDRKDDKPKIKIFEGKGNLDLAYDESFVLKGEVLYMSTIKYSEEIFPRTIRKLQLMKGRGDFTTRELVDYSADGRRYQQQAQSTNRQIRFMPKIFAPFEIDIGIFGQTVLITSVKKEFFTVSLQSSEIAQAFRMLFEAMWQSSVA